jgi:purine-binding chemotaxis protein CheW
MATSINIFALDDGWYGIPLAATREVFRLPAITPLPRAPAVIEGIINIRGRIVPVFNLRRRFGLAENPPHPGEHLLFATAGSRPVAMRVDRVLGAAVVDPQDVEAPYCPHAGASPFTGVAKCADGLVLIHDLGAFLDEAEAADLDKALAAASGP